MKLLSLIIPAYNMSELLPRCLDSIASAGAQALAQVEAVVVNDGSKDNTLAVAERYAGLYPDTVRVIDKPNGNYGSAINAALPEASGKYVKILDSDDWFDPMGLSSMLDSLAGTDADMVVTHFTIIHDDGTKELSKYNVYGKEPYEYGKRYELDDVLKDGYIRFFLMHALAYRTEFIRSIGYRQTEGISYTDTEWCIFPVFHARDIVFLDLDVYQYNLAREGQTMDPKVIAKSLDQMEKMTDSLMAYYESADMASLSDIRRQFINGYYTNRLRIMSKLYLYDIPRSGFNPDTFSSVDAKLQSFRNRNGLEMFKLIPENKLIRIDIYEYWRKHHSRLPEWLEKCIHLTDIVVKKLYVLIFRR